LRSSRGCCGGLDSTFPEDDRDADRLQQALFRDAVGETGEIAEIFAVPVADPDVQLDSSGD